MTIESTNDNNSTNTAITYSECYAQVFSRLFLGDCLIESDKIETGSADLILTDLPYGIMQPNHNGIASTKEGSLLPNLWEDISKLSGYSKYTSADKGSIGMYMDHPSEIYSRIMELKYKANLKPYENFTKELLEKIGGVERDASGKITRMSGLMPTSYSKNEERWLKLINKAPVLIPAIGSGIYFQSQQNETKE